MAAPPKPAKRAAQLPIPQDWKVELPEYSGRDDTHFFGCRNIESAYDRQEVLGMGTYGEVRPPGRRLRPLIRGSCGRLRPTPRARTQVYLAYEMKPGGVRGDKVAAKKIKMDNEKEGFPITAIRGELASRPCTGQARSATARSAARGRRVCSARGAMPPPAAASCSPLIVAAVCRDQDPLQPG
jgi:hypothetical protein